MANISKIKLPNGTTYTLKDNGALQLTGGTVSGPVSFNNSISIDDATIGNLVVNGSASFTNGIKSSSYNGGHPTYFIKGTQTAATNVWTGTLPDEVTSYYDGLIIDYFLPYAGTSTAATLNLSGLGAKPVYVGNTATSGVTTHYPANTVLHLTYVIASNLNSGNGCWKVTAYQNSTYWYTTVYCTTAAATAAKTGACSFYKLATGYFPLTIQYANTSASALTLNINSKGAKPIYINGTASSASNYTLPEGQYIAYYDGTNYHLRTDGKIPGNISGDAATVGGHTVGINVPSTAKFTDTVTTATTTGSGNAVTAITASNGALTVTKGTTFLTSHQSVSNKGATLSWGTAVTVATIGSTDIKVSLPSNPDTHHTAYIRAGASGGTANAATTTGNTYLNLVENGANRSGVKLVPGSNMAITSDASGNVTFTATIPANVSAFTNDAGYLTSESDPTVPAWAKAETKPTYTASEVGAAESSHTHNYAGSNSAGGPANKLYGIYTANGGQQGPSYFGTNAAGCLMSNATVNGDSHYKNWLYMDNYNGTDVGGATAIGLDRTEARAFIMQSAAERSTWANTAELHSTATIKCGTSDLTAGSSALTTGHIYFVYE